MSMEITTLLARSPEVCGGRLRRNGTRITVNQIVVWCKQGSTSEEIADQYPYLILAPVYTALAYYHANREDIEAGLAAEKIEVDRLEQEYQQTRGQA